MTRQAWSPLPTRTLGLDNDPYPVSLLQYAKRLAERRATERVTQEVAARQRLEQREAEEEMMLSDEAYPYDADWDDHDVD